MKNLLIKITKALVDNPEHISVDEVVSSQTVILELRVARTDMGKIIGKKGKTANAIRDLLSACSGEAGKKYILEIVD